MADANQITPVPSSDKERNRPAFQRGLGRVLDSFGIGIIFFLLCAFFSAQSDIFLSRSNFSNILVQTSVNMIIAAGMTFVICAAEIDLSVGSLLAVCGMITATLLKIDPATGSNIPMHVASKVLAPFPDLFQGAYAWWAISIAVFLVLAILPGILGGGTAGWLVARLGVPSFIVTLGFMLVYRGFARYMTNAAPITGLPVRFTSIGSGICFQIFGFRVAYSAIIAFCCILTGVLLLARTRYGRSVLAVGGNAQAAHLSGVGVCKVRMSVFMVSGFAVAVAAVIQTSRLFMGDPNAGEGYELDAIAAVIIGGTSLFGGRGSVVGTFFGVLIIGVLRNGLELMGVTDHTKQMIIGAMIIFAVLLDYYRRKLYCATR